MQNKKLVFRKTLKPIVSIIIPVCNKWNYTFKCLQSIHQNSGPISYEIIIADDGSEDETIHVHKFAENIIVVKNEKSRGFLKNCNHASTFASGKYLLFLNNDTQVTKNWLQPLIDMMEQDNKVGMVGSKLLFPNGTLQEAGGIIWSDGSAWNYGRGDSANKPEYNYVKEVDYISGACIMIRSELWKLIGGFDGRYSPAYYEDVDLAFEVRKNGYKVLFQPKSAVIHFEGISHSRDIQSGVKKYQNVNKQKFFEKWAETLKEQQANHNKQIFWARDRSKYKRTILFIDHHVPLFNQDAGGRCAFHYLKLFVKMGFRVIFCGDDFTRHEPYTSILQQLGIEVLYGPNYKRTIFDWIKKHGVYLDYVYLNRPQISSKYINYIKQHSKAKITYFCVDLHYLRELRRYNVVRDQKIMGNVNKLKKMEFDIIQKADTIHVVSLHEQELLKKEFPHKIIRNIPLFILEDFDFDPLVPFEKREGILFVGGFNHTPNQDAILWFVHKILPKIRNKIPHIKLYLVGSNPTQEIQRLANHKITVTGFIKDEELKKYYQQCKVAIAPLRYGAGLKGKVVEAMYHRLPLVTTPIGSEGLPNINQHLSISDSEQHFANQVVQLYCNKELWSKVSQQSGKYVRDYFSVDAAMKKILLDFNPTPNSAEPCIPQESTSKKGKMQKNPQNSPKKQKNIQKTNEPKNQVFGSNTFIQGSTFRKGFS